MEKSLINKIGNTTTTATDTRKKTTTKPRRRFGLTCSQKRERAKWAKINEKRRANAGLSKTARKAKNKAAEARIATHKTEVAAARRAARIGLPRHDSGWAAASDGAWRASGAEGLLAD